MKPLMFVVCDSKCFPKIKGEQFLSVSMINDHSRLNAIFVDEKGRDA